MFPVLFSIGNLTVSSFGFFLALAFLWGVFLVWRLCRAWELDEEKILDLTLLTFLGGLIGARIYFVISHLDFFSADLLKIILIPKYPGFSFWGGFLGGWLSLYFFARKLKLDFWHIADTASIGFLGGLVLSDLGCFLGGCLVGSPSKLFFAVPMVGVIGKRFPVQILESLMLIFLLRNLWSKAIHFHPRGKIVSLALIYIGIIKFIANFFRLAVASDYVFSVTIIVLGMTIFYQQAASVVKNKRTPLSDLKVVIYYLFNPKLLLSSLSKYWYNQKTSLSWKLRRMRVKSTR